MGGLWLEYPRKKMGVCTIMIIFAYMMICLIELNQLIRINCFVDYDLRDRSEERRRS